jgi:hypothetical protein
MPQNERVGKYKYWKIHATHLRLKMTVKQVIEIKGNGK